VVDLDDLDLEEARKAAKAEKAANAQPQGDPSKPGTGTPTQQPAAEPPRKDPAETPMIPKARFDEVLDGKSKAEQEAAYWRGQAEARAQTFAPKGQGTEQQQQPQPTPEQRLAEIHTAIDALAKQFDDGAITMADFKRHERELSAKEQAIREEGILAKVKPAAAPAPAEDMRLSELTGELEEAHPWVSIFDQVGTEAQWAGIKQLAIDNLVGRGIDPTRGATGKYELRREMAELMDKFGPELVGAKAKAKNIELPASQSPAPQPHPQDPPQPAKPPLSAAAVARQAALDKAANAPPDATRMSGAQGPNAGVPSEAAIAAMSDEDIDKLPVAVTRKIRGLA